MYEHFRHHKGHYQASLEQTFAQVLEHFFRHVADLLAEGMPDLSDPLVALTGIAPEAHEPTDPAVRRLLPTASNNEEAAAEFRRFTDISLREHKANNLRTAAQSLADAPVRRPRLLQSADDTMITVKLDEVTAGAWLTATADARLVLADLLGIADAADAALFEEWLHGEHGDNPDTERLQQGIVYEALADLQSSLIRAVSHNL